MAKTTPVATPDQIIVEASPGTVTSTPKVRTPRRRPAKVAKKKGKG